MENRRDDDLFDRRCRKITENESYRTMCENKRLAIGKSWYRCLIAAYRKRATRLATDSSPTAFRYSVVSTAAAAE